MIPGVSTIDIKKHIHKYLNGQNPDIFDERIMFMSVFHDIKWTEKGDNAKEVLPAASVRNYVVRFWKNLKKHLTLSHCQQLTYSNVILPTRKFPATEPVPLGQLRKKWRNNHIQRTLENKKTVVENILTSFFFNVFTNKFASDTRLKIRYLQREQRKMKSKSSSNPSRWHWLRDNSKQYQKLEATRWNNSQRITRRWFGNLPNRQHVPERWKWTILHYHCICYEYRRFLSFVQRVPSTNNFSKFEITSSSHRSCQDRTNYWNWTF